MPYLSSFEGVKMVNRYVRNWYSVIAVYIGFKHSTKADFKNGSKVVVSKEDYGDFRETLFRTFLKDNGFIYSEVDGHPLVATEIGIKLLLLRDYSNVIDEIFVRKAYGEPKLNGRIVIDVGGSIADTPLYFASLGARKVYAFEINPQRIQLAIKNVAINHMSRIIEIINRPATSAEILTIIKQNSLSNIFMKVDCDGCEYELIRNLPPSISESITDIIIEYTFGVRDLIGNLKALGYDVKHKRHLFFPDGILYATKKT
jgi:hypothetical protein